MDQEYFDGWLEYFRGDNCKDLNVEDKAQVLVGALLCEIGIAIVEAEMVLEKRIDGIVMKDDYVKSSRDLAILKICGDKLHETTVCVKDIHRWITLRS